MDQSFDQQAAVLQVEIDFIEVLEALSLQECRHNRRLRGKTKRVSKLLAKVAAVRRAIAKHAAKEDARTKGDLF